MPSPRRSDTLDALKSVSPGVLDSLHVITTEQLAALLSTSTDTLDRMHRAGEGPKRLRLSQRRVGYRMRDVQDWLAQREHG